MSKETSKDTVNISKEAQILQLLKWLEEAVTRNNARIETIQCQYDQINKLTKNLEITEKRLDALESKKRGVSDSAFLRAYARGE